VFQEVWAAIGVEATEANDGEGLRLLVTPRPYTMTEYVVLRKLFIVG
jgi:hypothetical protein